MKKLGIDVIIISIIISLAGTIMKYKQRAAIGIIGGADGPTSIFIAGRMGSSLGLTVMVLGILLLCIGIYFIFRKK